MGDRNEPPRHVDMQKWSDTWDRIRARQAEERAAAAAFELRDADASLVLDHLPPLPHAGRTSSYLTAMSNAPKKLAPCDHDECGLTECRLLGGSDQRLVLQSWEPGPLVAELDADFGDMAKNYQQHEKYREMRSLAIRLEHRLIALENDQDKE